MKIEIDTEKFDQEIDRLRKHYEDESIEWAEKGDKFSSNVCACLATEAKSAQRIFWNFLNNDGKIDVNGF